MSDAHRLHHIVVATIPLIAGIQAAGDAKPAHAVMDTAGAEPVLGPLAAEVNHF